MENYRRFYSSSILKVFRKKLLFTPLRQMTCDDIHTDLYACIYPPVITAIS